VDNQKVKRERERESRVGYKNVKNSKLAFTLVELLVVVSILAILSGAAYIGIQRSQARVMNEKVIADLSAITNALEQYNQDNDTYPIPTPGEDKNILCFNEDMSYAHDCTASVFVQSQIDNTLLTKRYLQEVPTDPRTGSRYSYGVTSNGKYFQIAGNYEEKDGGFTARMVGNIGAYPFLTSLIRSFDGSSFVVDGAGYLPYSPDHLSITATLKKISGDVSIDGESAKNGFVAQSGSTIKTEEGASAILYFSDGSVTHLDESTTLIILPHSKVQQNDKDGIITKIRLKLTSGKIWNKVARLASESEFNIETTSAIAGVRGTEFGIDENSELIVLSGSVAARKKTEEEQNTASEDGRYLEFNTDSDFTDTQLAEGDGTFKEFSIPNYDTSMPAGTAISTDLEDKLKEKYYINELVLSQADTPYIVKAKSHEDGTYTLYITFNGFETEDTINFDGFEIFVKSQTKGIRGMKEGALDNPRLIIQSDDISYSNKDNAYIFDIDENIIESIILRAFQDINGTKLYSRISWPLIKFVANKTEEVVYDYDNSNVYQEFTAVGEIYGTISLPSGGGVGGAVEFTGVEIVGLGTVFVGSSTTYSAKALYSDGTKKDIHCTSWTASSGGTATFPTGITYNASSSPTSDVVITCEYNSTSYTKKITITDDAGTAAAATTVANVIVDCPVVTVEEGYSVTCSVIALNSSSEILDINANKYNWFPPNSINPSNTDNTAEYTAPTGSAPTVNVYCTHNETNIPSEPVAIAVTPAPVDLMIAGTAQDYYKSGSSITVKVQQGSSPIPEITVHLTPGTLFATTDTSGNASFSSLPTPGKYNITATVTGSTVTSVPIVVCGYVGSGDECWVKGIASTASVPGESCTSACNAVGTCVDGDWDDTGGTACIELDPPAGTTVAPVSSASWAPFWVEGATSNNCTPLTSIQTATCDNEVPSIFNPVYRICRCQ